MFVAVGNIIEVFERKIPGRTAGDAVKNSILPASQNTFFGNALPARVMDVTLLKVIALVTRKKN